MRELNRITLREFSERGSFTRFSILEERVLEGFSGQDSFSRVEVKQFFEKVHGKRWRVLEHLVNLRRLQVPVLLVQELGRELVQL